jgi:S-adenosylmethionine hydrolase
MSTQNLDLVYIMSIVSLLSDFGHKDPYVAEMKATILSICPQAHIVDISHEIEKFDVRMGAFFLASATPYFPIKTIHVAVVDPGVGTKRRSIIVETRHSFYVGPDNGLLMLAANKECITNVYSIKKPEYMLSEVSNTFHGRDIFAPVAAHLANGIKPSDFGPAIYDYLIHEFAKPYTKNGELVGEVLHIDDFGNIISNISKEDLKRVGLYPASSITVLLGDKNLNVHLCSAYGDVPSGTSLALFGSSSFLEVAVNKGSAFNQFKAKIGDTFRVS